MCFHFIVIDGSEIADQKDEEVDFYRKKFAGSQADRIVRAEAEAENVAEKLRKTKVSGVLSHSSIFNECFEVRKKKTKSEYVVLSYNNLGRQLPRKKVTI